MLAVLFLFIRTIKINIMTENTLNTNVLPKYNCSNCKHFVFENKEIFESKSNGGYAFECKNVVHPLLDCVLRGFEAHSEQPSHSQTLNERDADLVEFCKFHHKRFNLANKEQAIEWLIKPYLQSI